MSDLSTSDLPRRRLGRGLSAMLGSGPAFSESESTTAELRNVAVAEISRNPFQPRKDFNPEDLNELSDSIREHGVLQPILVRELDGAYQLIAGERRWLASQRAGLTSIPCRVVDVVDQTAFDYALEENLKRKDLSDIEKAQAFRLYLDHFHCSIEELGKQLSMSRSAVSNILRLLELPESVRNALSAGKISSGHARSLLPLPEANQLALCGQIQAEQLSVRQTEATVRQMLGREKKVPAVEPAMPLVIDQGAGQATEAPACVMETQPGEFAPTQNFHGDSNQGFVPHHQEGQSMAPSCDNNWQSPPDGNHIPQEPQILSMEPARSETDRTPHIASLEEQLRNLLGTPVEIKLTSKESGTILIPFHSHEEFERLLRSLHRAAA